MQLLIYCVILKLKIYWYSQKNTKAPRARAVTLNTHFKGNPVSQLTINRKSVFWHSQIILAERK